MVGVWRHPFNVPHHILIHVYACTYSRQSLEHLAVKPLTHPLTRSACGEKLIQYVSIHIYLHLIRNTLRPIANWREAPARTFKLHCFSCVISLTVSVDKQRLPVTTISHLTIRCAFGETLVKSDSHHIHDDAYEYPRRRLLVRLAVKTSLTH